MLVRCSRILLCGLLAVALVEMGPSARIAHAELIATATLSASATDGSPRGRVDAFMQRDDVRAQLRALGVDPEEARVRVAGLSDAEIARIDARLDALPAGGDFLEVMLVIFVILILVLLVTDLLGWTDVFTFVKPLPSGRR